MGKRLFWLISRTAIACYRRAPVFGPIPGSIAIIRRDGGIVGLERHDGLGISMPGGMAHPWESPEQALRREVFEETGLTVVAAEWKFTYLDNALYPARTSLFLATAEGELRSSWEGTAGVFSLSELDRKIIPSQRRVVEYLKENS